MSRRGAERRAGLVSVVVVDDGDAGAVAATVDARGGCDWPAQDLEVVVVTTEGRGGVHGTLGSPPLALRDVAAPGAGRAGARNAGAAAARGEWLGFLGAGHLPDPGWLRHAVHALAQDSTLAAVASAILAPDGSPAWTPSVVVTGHPVPPSFSGAGTHPQGGPGSGKRDVLYAAVDAMVVRAGAFSDAGGFDERYDRLLDDVDLGWRLWLFGHRVAAVPGSSVRRAADPPPEGPGDHFLRDRNALYTIFKNYDEDSLAVAFPAALTLGAHRAARRPAPDDDRSLAASARAVDALARALPGLLEARRDVQERRVRTDAQLFGLFDLPTPDARAGAGEAEGTPEAAAEQAVAEAVADAFGVSRRFGRRRRIVVATCDALTPKMAGPGIRAWQIAQALAAEHDVQLVTTSLAAVSHPDFVVRSADDRSLAELERWCDVFVFQGWLITGRRFLLESEKVLVADIYDPLHLEQLEQGRDEGEVARRQAVRNATEVLNEQLMRGDFFLCANTRQRDFWLGQLAAVGRVNPRTYDEDATLESLIGVVPFGVSNEPPVHTRPAVKGVIPGIGPDDKVILWGGGIYNWFDPLTLLRAVDRLRRRQPAVRLLFMGLRHPNPDIPEMRMAVDTRALADDLGLTGTHVFFNEGWVPYDDRQNYLLEAEVGVSTHLAHLETALSSRTRILDYLWASLPVVSTEGDVLADLVEARGLGLTVPAADVDALEEALFRILDDEGFRKTCLENAAAVLPELTWSQVLQPLVEFCRRPRRAPDLLDPDIAARMRRDLAPAPRARGWRAEVRTGLDHLREGGPALLAAKAWGRLRRRLR